MRSEMNIPNTLPQFSNDGSLIIVSGKQDAVLYEAKDGKVTRLDAFKVPKPRYSDREGEFKTRTFNGGVMRSGSAKEVRDDSIIRDFMHEFKKRQKAIMQNFSKIYIFGPRQIKSKIKDMLSAKHRKSVTALFDGNYFSWHPLDLIKKIAASTHIPFSPQNQEERKLLSIPLQR